MADEAAYVCVSACVSRSNNTRLIVLREIGRMAAVRARVGNSEFASDVDVVMLRILCFCCQCVGGGVKRDWRSGNKRALLLARARCAFESTDARARICVRYK